MMRTTPTPSEMSPVGLAIQIITGTLVVAGLAALAWTVITRRTTSFVDPQAEVDRRIHDLEGSLNRLQDVVADAVS